MASLISTTGWGPLRSIKGPRTCTMFILEHIISCNWWWVNPINCRHIGVMSKDWLLQCNAELGHQPYIGHYYNQYLETKFMSCSFYFGSVIIEIVCKRGLAHYLYHWIKWQVYSPSSTEACPPWWFSIKWTHNDHVWLCSITSDIQKINNSIIKLCIHLEGQGKLFRISI